MTKHWTVFVMLATLHPLFAPAPLARADIFQWEYINPANPSQGKQSSTMLAPDGAGVNAVPAANLSNRNLTMAYLIGADLSAVPIYGGEFGNDIIGYDLAYLNGANLSQADLTNAKLPSATVTGANFTNAEVRGADLSYTVITAAQLYSTASYQARDLTGIKLRQNNLTGWNFVGQNFTGASFFDATLTGANLSQANLTNAGFQGATLTGANLKQVNLTNTKFDGANLTNADLSQTNLTTATFSELYSLVANLTGANLSQANLMNVNFSSAKLTGANLTGAEVRGANFFPYNYGSGITKAQLYSTASYQAHDLTGIGLREHDFTGANFAGQNLTNASFYAAKLTGANLSGADARGSSIQYATLTGANTSNLIQFNGHIAGLDLTAGASLVVRDYDGGVPIVVEQHLAMNAGGTLRLVFDADPWDSLISFAPGIPVARGGTLDLIFAPNVNLASQVGRTIDLFDWTGVTPTGAFTVSSPYTWNLSNLYTTGEVTLTAVPGMLLGDFNGNGIVDAADYVVWRKGLGTSYTQNDYNVWRAHFGQTNGSGAGASSNAVVPEPTTSGLFAIGLLALLCRQRVTVR